MYYYRSHISAQISTEQSIHSTCAYMLRSLYLPDSEDIAVPPPSDVPSHEGEGGGTAAGEEGVVVPDVGHLPHPVRVQLGDAMEGHEGSMVRQALGGRVTEITCRDTGCAISIIFSNSRSKR